MTGCCSLRFLFASQFKIVWWCQRSPKTFRAIPTAAFTDHVFSSYKNYVCIWILWSGYNTHKAINGSSYVCVCMRMLNHWPKKYKKKRQKSHAHAKPLHLSKINLFFFRQQWNFLFGWAFPIFCAFFEVLEISRHEFHLNFCFHLMPLHRFQPQLIALANLLFYIGHIKKKT